MKKILLILFLLTAPLTACSTFNEINEKAKGDGVPYIPCLLYTSDAADDTPCVDLGGRRIIKKN